MSTFYIDLDNGNNSNSGADWANAWKDITNGATAARIAPGDIIRISKTPDPVSIGNATWTDGSKTVTLATAQNATISQCESAWTGTGDTTIALTGVATDTKEGSYCMKLTLDSAVQTSILQAYFATGTLDLSAYQKISFWIKNSAAIVANNWYVALCSDTAGATPVDTFKITAIPSTARWLPLTLTKEGGGNLGSSIQSIAIYTDSVAPTASSNILVDNFIACTTSGLCLQSLISKNSAAQGGTEGFYAIQSIVGTTIILDGDTNTKSNATWNVYSGSTETVATYFRQGFKTALAASSTTAVNTINDSGSAAGGYIEYQGGYEVGTTNQNGETFFDGLNGNGYGIYASSVNFNKISKIALYRYNFNINMSSGRNNMLTDISNISNSTTYNTYLNISPNNIFENIGNINNGANYGIFLNANSNDNIFKNISNCNNNLVYQVYFVAYRNKINTNKSSGISAIYSEQGTNYFYDSTFSQTTEFSSATTPVNNWIWSLNHDNTLGNHWGFTYQATVNLQTSVVHSTEPVAWKTAITGNTRTTLYPVKLKVAEVAFEADIQVTVTAWVKKDHATDVGCKLVAYANTSVGINSDVADTKADDTDWEQLSISFTPTEAGVTEIHLESYYVSGNSNTYIGSITVSQ